MWRTHIGLVRRANEDRVLIRPDSGLFAIADGMGGHERGDVAAQCVVDALAGLGSARGEARRQAALDALERVNRDLRSRSLAVGVDAIMGSTVVALLIEDHWLTCLWAGDSRAYLFRDRHLVQLTQDHSIVQELIDTGALGETERDNHPQSGSITRAVGAHDHLDVATTSHEIRPGDRILLCSDGLSAAISSYAMAIALIEPDGEDAADLLISYALSAGGQDNISLVVVNI